MVFNVTGAGSSNIEDSISGFYTALGTDFNSYVQPNSFKPEQLNLGSGTISSLFNLCDGGGNATLASLKEEFPEFKMFIIAILLIAKAEEGTTENFVASINAAKQRQTCLTEDIIKNTKEAQDRREKLANEESNWQAKAGTSPSGSPSKEKVEPDTWWKILLKVFVLLAIAAICIVAMAIGSIAGPAGAFLGLALVIGIIMMVVGILETIKTNANTRAAQKNIDTALSFISPTQIVTDLVFDIIVAGDKSKLEDKELQKAKMWLKFALDIAMAVLMIVLAFVTGGSSASAATSSVARAIASIAQSAVSAVEAIVTIVTSIQELRKGVKELELADRRYVINKLQAFLTKMRLDLDVLAKELDLLIEMFSTSLDDVMKEYDKASRTLKEYNDQIRAIAKNVRV
ncbi:MAG: hypothetical protein LBI81_02410 [Puniceicoccales bacterium]|jgi:hypothetical protein|nr:hypothetical protein [Puniceicoccales bacterium]